MINSQNKADHEAINTTHFAQVPNEGLAVAKGPKIFVIF
jgi:hypothetical protein